VDLVFANDRMAGEARGVASALEVLTAKAPGADCYLLTQAGAERLMDLTARQKIQCGVDWALVWNALDTRAGLMRDELRVLARLLPPGPAMIDAAVLDRPLARLRPGPSRIDHSTTRPLTELIGQEALLAHTEFVSLIRLGLASLRFAGRSGPDPVMEAHRRGELWEADALAALIRRFPEGGSFLDIGAHLGNHTVALGCLSAAQVIAVEPNPEITRLWHMNAGLNGINAELCPVALGAQEGPGTLTIRRRMPGNSQVRAGVAPKSDDLSEPTHSVEIIPGDDLVGTRRIDAIKIDTSGREADVLRGLKRVLRRDRPLVLIEHRQDEADRIGQLLARSGLGVAEEFPAGKPARRLSLFTPDGR
ncbi:MAG: FkbM family methyltransferase, partial [Pseudomonadota bacterium]